RPRSAWSRAAARPRRVSEGCDMPASTHTSNRFYVMIDGTAQAIFTEVSGLQIETEVQEYAEGGNNGFVHRLPGRTRVGNITLKRGITGSEQLLKCAHAVAAG